MYELRRLKRHGFVSLGKASDIMTLVHKLANNTFILNIYDNTYVCDDGFTYEIKYV